MHGITKLTIAAALTGLVTTPCWREKPKTQMDLLADKIALCNGVTEVVVVGSNTQARIDLVLNPAVSIADIEQCVREKVEKDGLIQSNFYPVCTSKLLVESSNTTPPQISVVIGKTTCLPTR